ncbi:hypothetical protein [Staphylococcus casei]|uniref:Uncharacterized protein n=1 Tax=Staphylococcus casei TaxID=201828 RepID=A0ABZ2WBT2_9STAP
MNEKQLKKLYKERKHFLTTLLNSQKISLTEYEKSMNHYREFLKCIKDI